MAAAALSAAPADAARAAKDHVSVSATALPQRAAIREAFSFAGSRAGAVSVAIVDSRGHSHGLHPDRGYVSASVVKAMLLVAYLRQIDRYPIAAERAVLGPMIARSKNKDATEIYRRVGDAGLIALARRAGMRSFSVCCTWTLARITAADQARFFHRIDRFVPRVSRAYAHELLSSVIPQQRWGFARPALLAGFSMEMKAGWRPTPAGRLLHAVGAFERGGRRISLAILTDGSPTHDYAVATVSGIAERVFGGAARPASGRLVDIHRFAPGIALDIRYATPNNITGAPLPGYCKPRALMLEPAARAVAQVQRRLRRRGLGLTVFDAYRPVRATNALVEWAEESGRPELVGTYIARRSRHNVGRAVDLTLTGRTMGSAYDDLSPRAHTYSASGKALQNRLILRTAMERFGFAPYDREWWHFEHRSAGDTPRDVTLGCG